MIHIIDNIYAKSNNLGFSVICCKKGEENKEKQITIGYCGNMEEVLLLAYKTAVSEKIRDRDLELAEAIKIMKETKEMIRQVVGDLC